MRDREKERERERGRERNRKRDRENQIIIKESVVVIRIIIPQICYNFFHSIAFKSTLLYAAIYCIVLYYIK